MIGMERGDVELRDAARALDGTAERATVSVDGRRLELSELNLGLWPDLTSP